MVHILTNQITAAMFCKFCKLILKITVALDNNSATFVFLVGYPKVSLLLSLYVRGMKKILMTRLSVCSLGVSCNEMIDTPLLLVVYQNCLAERYWILIEIAIFWVVWE